MLLTPVSLWRCVVLSRVRDMSTEDEPKGPPFGFSSTREDVSLSFVDLANSPELGRRSREHRLHTATPHTDVSWWGPYMNRHRIKCTCSRAKHVHQQLQPKRFKEFAWFFVFVFFLVIPTLPVEKAPSWKYWRMQKQLPMLLPYSLCHLKMPWKANFLYVAICCVVFMS